MTSVTSETSETGVTSRRPRPARFVVPATCGALALALHVVAAVLHAAEPTAVRGMPALGSPTWWWGAAVLVAQGVVLALRPRATPWLLVAVAVGVPALSVLGEGVGVGLLAVVVAAYEATIGVLTTASSDAARRAPRLRTLAGFAAAALLVGAGVAASELRLGNAASLAVVGGLLQALGTVGLPVLAATVVGSRRDARAAHADSAAARAREHDALVRVAVERERTAMARELHDIAAHHLSGIAVMSGAIGRQIDVDPEGAKAAVAQVREQSTAMLRDLRHLVVLLRDDDRAVADADGRADGGNGGTDRRDGVVRMETLAGVAELVERAPGATLRRSGPLDAFVEDGALGPLAQLVVYRTVQEALANASRHAPGATCEVHLDATDGTRLEVGVRNGAPTTRDLPPHEPGYGLVGMRERAEVTGATLRYGPTAEGGWVVHLTVPTTTGGRV